MKKLLLLAAFATVLTSCKNSNEEEVKRISVVPKPLNSEIKEGEFEFNKNTSIHYEGEELKSTANYLQEQIKKITGWQLDLKKKLDQNQIQIMLGASDTLGTEGYKFIASEGTVEISAFKANGAFYGVQTLLQLVFNGKKDDGGFEIPCAEITDKPKFSWRGMHLDVCRHFFPKEFIKKYIDILAMHKMNTFHWHLTEDQGWRIEIKQYPKLQEISSKRKGTVIKKNWGKYDGIPHGGYYTQEEVKEIVAYAKERFITIVPEIEMPGHSLAALAAYPELGCTGGPYEVSQTWGVFNDVYCAGNEKTFEFLQNVVSEVIDLFPGEFFHVGGDECPKKAWEKCPKCQKRIAKEGLKNEHELQSYFIERMEKFLNSKGKRLIGWDEILEGGLAPNATVMSWRGEKGGIEAAEMGHDVVMSPGSHCYFDHYQGDTASEPFAIGGFTTLEKTYSYNPVPAELSPEKSKHILGCQGNVWTEYILDEDHVEYMALPRMCALAEVGWLPAELKNEDGFLNRMKMHYNYLDFNDVNYRIPWPKLDIQTIKEKNMLMIDNFVAESKIEYKIGDSEMKQFEESIEVKKGDRLTLVITLKSGRKSPEFIYEL